MSNSHDGEDDLTDNDGSLSLAESRGEIHHILEEIINRPEYSHIDEEDVEKLHLELYDKLSSDVVKNSKTGIEKDEEEFRDETVLAVCALTKERDYLKTELDRASSLSSRISDSGEIIYTHNGDTKCILKAAGEPGIDPINDVTRSLSNKHDPDLVILFGIAAGIEERVDILDTIIAKKVIDLRHHSVKPEGYTFDSNTFSSPKNRTIPVTVDEIKKRRSTIDTVENDIAEKEIHTDLHIGSSNTLSKDKQFMNDAKAINRNLGGIEMEAVGVAKVCDNIDTPFFVVKTIVDYGSPDKNDAHHSICKELAAKTVYHGFIKC